MFPSLLLLLAQLTVHVHPYGNVSSRSRITVDATIERNPDNRGLVVQFVDADGFPMKSTERELEGEKAPTHLQFEFRDLDEGSYQVWVTLIQWKDGKWKLSKVKGENLEIR